MIRSGHTYTGLIHSRYIAVFDGDPVTYDYSRIYQMPEGLSQVNDTSRLTPSLTTNPRVRSAICAESNKLML